MDNPNVITPYTGIDIFLYYGIPHLFFFRKFAMYYFYIYKRVTSPPSDDQS